MASSGTSSPHNLLDLHCSGFIVLLQHHVVTVSKRCNNTSVILDVVDKVSSSSQWKECILCRGGKVLEVEVTGVGG